MYGMLRNLSVRHLLAAEAPALVLAMVLAETLYRFGSFTLECVAFLATWYAIGWLVRAASPRA